MRFIVLIQNTKTKKIKSAGFTPCSHAVAVRLMAKVTLKPNERAYLEEVP